MSLAYLYLFLCLAQSSAFCAGYYSGASAGYRGGAPGGGAPGGGGVFSGAAYGGQPSAAPPAQNQDLFANSDAVVHSAQTGLAMDAQARMALQAQQSQARYVAATSIAEIESLVAEPYALRDLFLMKHEELVERREKLGKGLTLLASMRHMRVSEANGLNGAPGGAYGAPGVPGPYGYGPPGGAYGVQGADPYGYGSPGGAYGVQGADPYGYGAHGFPGQGGYGYGPYGAYGHAGSVPYGHYGNVNVHTVGVVHDVHVDSNTGGLERKLREAIKRCEAALRKTDILMLEENESERRDLASIVKDYSTAGVDMETPSRRRRFRSSRATSVNRTIEDDYQKLQNFIASYGEVVRDMMKHSRTAKTEYIEVCTALKGVLIQYINELTVKVKEAVTSIASGVGQRQGSARRAISSMRNSLRERDMTGALKADYPKLQSLVKVLETDDDIQNAHNAYPAEADTAISAAKGIEDMPELSWALRKDEYIRPGFTVHDAESAERFLQDLPQLIQVPEIAEETLDDVLEKISAEPELHKSISLAKFMRAEDACRQERLKEALRERMDEGDWPIKVREVNDNHRLVEREGGFMSRGLRKVKRFVRGNAMSNEGQKRRVNTHVVTRAITHYEGIDIEDEDALALRNAAIDYFVSCLSDEQKEFLVMQAEEIIAKWQELDENKITHQKCSVRDFDKLMLAQVVGWANQEGQELMQKVAHILFSRDEKKLRSALKSRQLKSRVRAVAAQRRFIAYGVETARYMDQLE